MKKIVFILSSLNDVHYQKRVKEFIDKGYHVEVYEFKRKNQSKPSGIGYNFIILGEIENRNFLSRLGVFRKAIKSISKDCNGKICFYGSLDIAIFATIYIKSRYLYEVCDLTELVFNNSIIRNILILINKSIIKKSINTIVTSEGFIDFFNTIDKEKFCLIPNKVDPRCPLPIPKQILSQTNRLKIGFVGVIRFETVYNFIKVCSEINNGYELHLFGIYSEGDIYAEKIKKIVANTSSIYFHGRFKNPEDLPSIYSQIDLLLCTYPPTLGVRYAEPNKLYEATYFRCPIIVNAQTFLAEKVKKIDVGYVVDALDEKDIYKFIQTLSCLDYQRKVESCEKIPRSSCLNINDEYFDKIESLC